MNYILLFVFKYQLLKYIRFKIDLWVNIELFFLFNQCIIYVNLVDWMYMYIYLDIVIVKVGCIIYSFYNNIFYGVVKFV